MNRPLPRADCRRRSPDERRAPGPGGTVLGAGGLVGGTAAPARQRRLGHRCATFGPRFVHAATAWRVGQSRRDGPIMQESRREAGKPATAVPGGPGRKEVFDAIC